MGPITNVGQWCTESIGVVESMGTPIAAIPSLFVAQLNDRTKLIQSIDFKSINEKYIGEEDFYLEATSSSALPVVYTSTNPLVANVTGNRVHINSVGSTSIIASQSGNNFYHPASSVSRSLMVKEKISNKPSEFFMNPVKSVFDFSYNLNNTSRVKLDIYSVHGQLIKAVFNKSENSGSHIEYGIDVSALKNGTYLLKYTINNQSKTFKIEVIH